MTIDELNALQDNQNWQQVVAQSRLKKPQQQKKKGFWQDQISTGGGISGAIAGGLAGAAIGAPAGGIGAIPGGLVGAIIGGFGGGSAGQYIENGVVGEEDMSKDVLKEGLLNGAFAVGPIRGANVAFQGTKALAQGAGRTGVREAVEQAATATPIRNALLGKTAGAGRDMRRGVANTVKVSDSFTQENNILDSLSRNGLKGSAASQYKNVDTVLGNISNDIDSTLSTITVTAPRQSVLTTLQKTAADALPSDATYTKELTRSLERLSKSGAGDVGPQELFAFKQELGGRLGNAFNKLNKGAPLTAKEEVDMALWKSLDNEITSLAPAVKQMTRDQSNLINARPGLQAGSQKTLGIPLLGIKSQGAERLAQGARDVTGRALSGTSQVRLPGNPTGPIRTAGRMAVGDNLVNAMFMPGGAPDMDQEDMVTDDMSVDGSPDMGAMTEGPSNPFGVSQEAVAQEMLAALQAGDTKGFGTLKDLYDMIGEYETANAPSLGGGKPETVEGQKAYNNAVSGIRAIDDLEAMLAEDGSLTWKSSLPGGSLTDSLLGASQYETARGQAIDAMTRLTTGAALTKQESDQLKKRLPQAGDSPETVAYKLAQFRTYFNEVLNQPQGGTKPSTLEEAMTGGY